MIFLAQARMLGADQIFEVGGMLSHAIGEGFSGPRYARHGASPILNCVVAEDGSSMWMSKGSHFLQDQQFRWHQVILPAGEIRQSELFRFRYFSASKKVVAYTLSQSALVEPAFTKLPINADSKKGHEWNLTRDGSGIAAALDARRVVSITSENARESKTMVAAALIDTSKRGTDPNLAVGTGIGVDMRDPMIGSTVRGTTFQFAEASEREVKAFSYEFKSNKLTKLAVHIPTIYKGKPVMPQLHDFKQNRTFYDFALPGDDKKRIWTEYDGKSRRWHRYPMPQGDPGPVYLARGTVWANTWDSAGVLQLYMCSSDRSSWRHIGPFVLVGRSHSDRYWVLYDASKKKVFEAVFSR